MKAIFLFIAPPTVGDLERRLRGRGTESDDQIKHRLENAAKEMERQAAPVYFNSCLPTSGNVSRVINDERLVR